MQSGARVQKKRSEGTLPKISPAKASKKNSAVKTKTVVSRENSHDNGAASDSSSEVSSAAESTESEYESSSEEEADDDRDDDNDSASASHGDVSPTHTTSPSRSSSNSPVNTRPTPIETGSKGKVRVRKRVRKPEERKGQRTLAQTRVKDLKQKSPLKSLSSQSQIAAQRVAKVGPSKREEMIMAGLARATQSTPLLPEINGKTSPLTKQSIAVSPLRGSPKDGSKLRFNKSKTTTHLYSPTASSAGSPTGATSPSPAAKLSGSPSSKSITAQGQHHGGGFDWHNLGIDDDLVMQQVRKRLARKERQRQETLARHAAQVEISRVWRGHFQRQRWERVKGWKMERKRRNEAAKVIQEQARPFLSRRRAVYRKEARELQRKQHASAFVLQRFCKLFLAKKQAARIRMDNYNDEKVRRERLARLKVQERRAKKERLKLEHDRLKHQRWKEERQQQKREELSRMEEERRMHWEKQERIKKWRRDQEKERAKEKERELKLTTKREGMLELERERAKQRRHQKKRHQKNVAATKIQALFRGVRGRNWVQRNYAKLLRRKQKGEAARETRAATRIQAIHRGRVSRQRVSQITSNAMQRFETESLPQLYRMYIPGSANNDKSPLPYKDYQRLLTDFGLISSRFPPSAAASAVAKTIPEEAGKRDRDSGTDADRVMIKDPKHLMRTLQLIADIQFPHAEKISPFVAMIRRCFTPEAFERAALLAKLNKGSMRLVMESYDSAIQMHLVRSSRQMLSQALHQRGLIPVHVHEVDFDQLAQVAGITTDSGEIGVADIHVFLVALNDKMHPKLPPATGMGKLLGQVLRLEANAGAQMPMTGGRRVSPPKRR